MKGILRRLRFTKKRQAYEEERRAEYKAWLTRSRQARQGQPPTPVRIRDVELAAPAVFNFSANAAGVTKYFRRVEASPLHERVFVDLSEVRELGIDALAVLLSRLKHPRLETRVAGNTPGHPAAKRLFEASGFLDHVRRRGTGSAAPLPVQSGSMFGDKGRLAAPDQAAALIDFITEQHYGTRRMAVNTYQALIDLMGNTFEHAGSSPGAEQWFAAAYYDRDTKVSTIAFVDNGVSILKSLNVNMWRRVISIRSLKEEVQLRKILEGELAAELRTRTGDDNRGKGLPYMYERARQGLLGNLVIVSGSVYAHIDQNIFTTLERPFRGTLFRWELRE